jgi:hypothetical protein
MARPKTLMKMSTAMLKGAKLLPQCKGDDFTVVDGKAVASCAVGAALHGYHGKPITDWPDHWPTYAQRYRALNGLSIEARNDHNGWSRERIARKLAKAGW